MKKSNRATASIFTAISGVFLILSGLIMLFGGHGTWEGIHIVFGLAFMVAVGFHIYYNWGALSKHFRLGHGDKTYKKPLVFAVVCMLLLAVAVPSVSWLFHHDEAKGKMYGLHYDKDRDDCFFGDWFDKRYNGTKHGDGRKGIFH